jgi:PAS domain S-box-containing protein
MAKEKKKQGTTDIERSLRDDAEKQVVRFHKSSSDLKDQTPEQLIHELRVHQIELEMQAEELRRAHLALEESRDTYLDLYEFAPLGYLTLTDKGLISNVNLTGASLLGEERRDLLNARFSKFVAEPDGDEWHRYFMRVLDREEKQMCTLMLQRGDGTVFPARLEGVRRTGGSDGTRARIAVTDISDIWQIEALKKSEEKFRRIFETLEDVYYHADMPGNIIDISPSCKKLLGYSPEELTGTPIKNYYLHPEDWKKFLTDLQKNGSLHDYEVTLKHRDGRPVPVSVNTHTLVDTEGHPAALEGTIRDISRRLEMEHALQRAAAYNRSLIEASVDPLVTIDRDGTITDVNKTAEKATGISREHLIGTDFSEYFTEPYKARAGYRKVFQEGTVRDYPLELRHMDGSTIFVHYNASVYRDENGEVAGVFAAARDITHRKEIEEKLLESKELLNRAISGSGVGLWDWNIQTGETIFNERWAEIVGYTLKELEPVSIETWISLTRPEDLARSDELLAKHFAGESPDYECEVRMRHRNGLFVWVLDRGKVTGWDSNGKPLRMTGTRLDITRRKELEMELEFHERELVRNATDLANEIAERKHAEEEIKLLNNELEARVEERTQDLAETVSKLREENAERQRVEKLVRLTNRKLSLMNDVTYQDIQNKVTALSGFVSIIQNVKTEEERQAFYGKEKDILKAIHNLIKNTKEYQKMGVDQFRWLDVEKIIRNVPVSLSTGISIKTDIHGLFIYTDPLVSRVFGILIDNAVTHGKKTTRILFSCHKSPLGITLICEDDGVGIPAGEKGHIFDRITAGEGKFDLFFMQEFLTLSGMAVSETGEPGKGARFEITVPEGMWRAGETGD